MPTDFFKKFVNSVPGRRTLGIYRFIPVFIIAGAAVEFTMIKWTVGETNFYRVYKRNQAAIIAREIFEQEKKAEAEKENIDLH